MIFLSSPEAFRSKPTQPPRREPAGRLPAHPAAGAVCEPAPPVAAPQPAFDADAAVARVEGNCELLRKMIGVFALQWNRQWAEIAKAGQRRDGTALQLTAHQLQRSLDSFGAAPASRVAQKLDTCGSQREFHNVEQSCATLKLEIERLVNALKEFTQEAVA